MKVFVISVSLGLFTLLPISQSEAIFGLSKCEKVKKEIIAKEKNISRNIGYLQTKLDSTVLISSKEGARIFESNQAVRNDVYKVWKIATNNPKCFTNTQRIAVADKSQWLQKSYIQISPLAGKWIIYEENSFLSLYLL